MYCPKCSQEQVSAEVQFCSRCGLALLNLKEIVLGSNKTIVKEPEGTADRLSPRQKGTRQGVLVMLLSIILIPAYILLAALFPSNDRLVESSVSDTPFEKISQAVLITVFLLGLARLLYARIFQTASTDVGDEVAAVQFEHSSANYSLPPARTNPVSGFGTWRETGEIVQTPDHN